MYKSNILVLVYTNNRNKVVIWDDHEKKSKTEIAFNSTIKRILLREDMLIVVLEEKIFVFNFDTYKLIE
jgi:hypothetical protein